MHKLMAGYVLHFETGIYSRHNTCTTHSLALAVLIVFCLLCSNGETVASARISSPAIAQRGSLKKVGYFHIPYQLTV